MTRTTSTMKLTRGTLIREIPHHDRPRERLMRQGAGALSDAELLAVLLRTGCRGRSAVDLGAELLSEARSLTGLLSMPMAALRRPGLGVAKAAAVHAAIELARRLARCDLPRGDLLADPAAVVRYLGLRYGEGDQEVMGALYLDTRNRLLDDRALFRGTLSRAAVEPRAIFKHALLQGAAGVVLFHNHPSGDPSPSPEDLTFTRRMDEAGTLLGVRLIDHLILGSVDRWVSLRRRGW